MVNVGIIQWHGQIIILINQVGQQGALTSCRRNLCVILLPWTGHSAHGWDTLNVTILQLAVHVND